MGVTMKKYVLFIALISVNMQHCAAGNEENIRPFEFMDIQRAIEASLAEQNNVDAEEAAMMAQALQNSLQDKGGAAAPASDDDTEEFARAIAMSLQNPDADDNGGAAAAPASVNITSYPTEQGECGICLEKDVKIWNPCDTCNGIKMCEYCVKQLHNQSCPTCRKDLKPRLTNSITPAGFKFDPTAAEISELAKLENTIQQQRINVIQGTIDAGLDNQDIRNDLRKWQIIMHLIALHRYTKMPQDTTEQEKETKREVTRLGINPEHLQKIAKNDDQINTFMRTPLRLALLEDYGHATDLRMASIIMQIIEEYR